MAAIACSQSMRPCPNWRLQLSATAGSRRYHLLKYRTSLVTPLATAIAVAVAVGGLWGYGYKGGGLFDGFASGYSKSHILLVNVTTAAIGQSRSCQKVSLHSDAAYLYYHTSGVGFYPAILQNV